LRVSDEALLPEVGLDAVFFIKFCRMVRRGVGAQRGTRALARAAHARARARAERAWQTKNRSARGARVCCAAFLPSAVRAAWQRRSRLAHAQHAHSPRAPQCLHFIAVTAVFDLSVVLWANISGTQTLTQTSSDLDRFTMAHVAPQAGSLWVHFVSVVLKTIVVLVLMYRVCALFASPVASLTRAWLTPASVAPAPVSPPAVALDFQCAGPRRGGAAEEAGGAHRVRVRRPRRGRCGCAHQICMLAKLPR
jgi:hypothetical protein